MSEREVAERVDCELTEKSASISRVDCELTKELVASIQEATRLHDAMEGLRQQLEQGKMMGAENAGAQKALAKLWLDKYPGHSDLVSAYNADHMGLRTLVDKKGEA